MLDGLYHIEWLYLGTDGLPLPQTAHEGRAALLLKIDTHDVLVDPEQNLLGWGAVFLDDSIDVEFVVPADVEDGRQEPITVHGATDDPETFRLVYDFLDAIEHGTFVPKNILDLTNGTVKK